MGYLQSRRCNRQFIIREVYASGNTAYISEDTLRLSMMGVVQYLFVVLAYTLVSQVAGDDWSCCDESVLSVDLTNRNYTNTGTGFTIGGGFNDNTPGECDWQVVIKASFNLPSNCSDFCTKSCDRRMLKIEMKIDDDRRGWLAHVGNSPTNDGDKGDDPNNHIYDSNLVIYNENITAHANENCNDSNLYIDATASSVTVNIASGYYRIRNSEGLDVSVCERKCFFDFFGKNDTAFGGQNDFILYGSFNRVINQGSSRVGKGVCKASLSWECCED